VKGQFAASLTEPSAPVRFGALPAVRVDVLQRAIARAREAGAAAAVAPEGPPDRLLQAADVIVSLPWPVTNEHQTAVLAAMAARKAVIVLETTSTAEWPALDPQTWRPRGLGTDAPIVISLDPRDEEHSLVLAIQRLSKDAPLRARLADAAHAWATKHTKKT
jgi:hypothetical protein